MNRDVSLRVLFRGGPFFPLMFVLLLYAIVPIAEVLFFVYLADLVGGYLILMIVAVLGIASALIGVRQARDAVQRLSATVKSGKYAGKQVVDLIGLAAAGILLITPGFITDVVAFAVLIPGVRLRLGRWVALRLRERLPFIRPYLRLREL